MRPSTLRRFHVDLFAPRHLLIILVIVILVFGTKKLSTIGADLGAAVRGFKKSMREGEQSEPPPATEAPQQIPDAAAKATHEESVNKDKVA